MAPGGPRSGAGKKRRSNVFFVCCADGIKAGFELEADAWKFWDAMRERFQQFALELHEDETRLLEFGRFAV